MNEMKQKQYNEYDKCRVFVNSVCQRLYRCMPMLISVVIIYIVSNRRIHRVVVII